MGGRRRNVASLLHPSTELVTNFEYTTAANYPVIVAASSAAAAAGALSFRSAGRGRPTAGAGAGGRRTTRDCRVPTDRPPNLDWMSRRATA